MAVDGTTVIRMYPFDPSNQYGSYALAIYVQPSSLPNGSPDQPLASTDYPSAPIPIAYTYTDQVGYDAATDTLLYATQMGYNYEDVPVGTEFVEVQFIPLVSGVADPIDPFAPPATINMRMYGHYAAGVVEVGTYLNGQYVIMGSQEIRTDGDYSTYSVALTAAVMPPTPAFWTGFVQCVELIEGEVLPPPLRSDGVWTSDAGFYDPDDGYLDDDGLPVGVWKVPAGTTFTAINPGQIETLDQGGIFIQGSYMGGSDFGFVTWVGSFVFSIDGSVVALSETARISTFYDPAISGVFISGTVDIVTDNPAIRDEIVLYVDSYSPQLAPTTP